MHRMQFLDCNIGKYILFFSYSWVAYSQYSEHKDQTIVSGGLLEEIKNHKKILKPSSLKVVVVTYESFQL